MVITFGKYKGREFHEVPRYYLQWLLDNMQPTGELRAAIEWGMLKVPHDPRPVKDIEAEVELRLGWWFGGEFVEARPLIGFTPNK